MLKGEGGVCWVETNIFQHLCDKFPDDYKRIKVLTEKEEDDDNNDANQGDDEKSDDADEADEHESRASSSDSGGESRMPKIQAEAIYQVIDDLKEASHLAKRQLNIDLIIFALMGRYKIDSADYARHVIAARASIITDIMTEKKTFAWSRKAIFRELKLMARRRKDLQNAILTPLRPRRPGNDDSSSSSSSSSPPGGEKGRDREAAAKSQRYRGRKSLLRPKGSVSSKQFSRIAQASGQNEDLLSSSSDEDQAGGHAFVRDPSSTRAGRISHFILSDTETPLKTPQRETLQTRNTSHDASEYGDSHPTDTWICPSCGKVIYKSSPKQSTIAIRDHSLAHANDMQMQLDLVFAEQRLNVDLPVDNLVGRIKRVGGTFTEHDAA